MLILRLNENKELNSTKTSPNFTGENNFEKIRIVAEKAISGKNLTDLTTELYIYNIIDDDWYTFNDCVPVEWTNENDKLIFEIPVKGQYTVFPTIGMHLKFTDEGSVVGKTNIVKTMILHHKDSTIDASNSIELFEQYKNQLSNISGSTAVTENTTRLYFKLNCPEWTTPRVYLFNDERTSTEIPYMNFYEAWRWSESPYMIQDENDPNLYYLDLDIFRYKYIIFFCDERGVCSNYKTNDLLIPSGAYYPQLYYYQSPIGYDGIWADKPKETFSLFVQASDQEIQRNVKIIVDGQNVTGKILGNIGTGIYQSYAKYIKYEIPLTANHIEMSMDDTVQTYSVYELCYNIPVIYLENNSLKIFDGSIDEVFMFNTRYTNQEYALYRDIYNKYGCLGQNAPTTEAGQIDIQENEYQIRGNYTRIGNICFITGRLSIHFSIDVTTYVQYRFENILPYIPADSVGSNSMYAITNLENGETKLLQTFQLQGDGTGSDLSLIPCDGLTMSGKEGTTYEMPFSLTYQIQT